MFIIIIETEKKIENPIIKIIIKTEKNKKSNYQKNYQKSDKNRKNMKINALFKIFFLKILAKMIIYETFELALNTREKFVPQHNKVF